MLKYYEIAESGHRIQGPFSLAKLELLGDICRPQRGMRHLDIACGQGELLTRWAQQYGTRGTGVDMSAVFIANARQRALERGVTDQTEFVISDAVAYVQDSHDYDIVSCIGASWIGNGTIGTLDLMKKALKPGADSLLIIGEIYWQKPPPPEVCAAMGVDCDDWAMGLDGLFDRFDQAGVRVVNFIMADDDSWDRYFGLRLQTGHDWLRAHPDHEDALGLSQWLDDSLREYIRYERPYCGWGVFVLKVAE